ncbi:MAG TPA: hypothetical protein VEH76_05885 [Methylocystis sp.]|nr:hypothetical protein [Methylocystis sp.]
MKSKMRPSDWLATELRVRRLSPLMATALAGLSSVALAGGVYAAGVLLGLDAPASLPPAASDWRPPGFAGLEPSPPKAPGADEQILQRPVFFKSRRPAPVKSSSGAEKPKETLVAAQTTPLSVAGIVRNGASALAFLSTGAGEGEWCGVGEKIAGWTVAEIGRIDLTVTSGDKRAQVKLYPDYDPNVAPEPSSAPPPSPAPAPTILRQRHRT